MSSPVLPSFLPRRHLLGGMAAVTLTAGPLGRLALAAAPAATEARFVLIILRGAMDGLGAVPPLFDPDYARLRAGLLLPEPGKEGGALPLDGRFALHPALSGLHPWFAGGELAIIHAVASPYRGRSHFDGQDVLENGLPGQRAGATDGWLNRALAVLPGGAAPGGRRLGLAVGQTPPLALRGAAPAASWAPSPLPEIEPDLLQRLSDLYAGDPLLRPALAEGMADQRFVDRVLGNEMGEANKRGNLPGLVKAAAKLLSAPEGARIATLELGGWDTHAGQGTNKGRLASALQQLGEGLASFKTEMGSAWGQTVVLVATEFGRTAAANGTGGTDHGTASCCFVAGGAVKGGRVLGHWPGLAKDQLFEGRDLMPTTDLRAVAKGILRDHLKIADKSLDSRVFPDSGSVVALNGLIRGT